MRIIKNIILPFILIISATLIVLYILNIIPVYLKKKGIEGTYDSIEEAQKAIGLKILTPSYFPETLIWPPAKITIKKTKFPTIILSFISKDSKDGFLKIYEIISISYDSIDIDVPDTIDEEYNVKLNDRVGRMVVGKKNNKLLNRLSWNNGDRYIILLSNYPPHELLRMAKSMIR